MKTLRGKGKVSQADLRATMREIRLALLEADVNFQVVRNFVKTVEERANGAKVLEGLNPSQQIVKIVDEELTKTMGKKPFPSTNPRRSQQSLWCRGFKVLVRRQLPVN